MRKAIGIFFPLFLILTLVTSGCGTLAKDNAGAKAINHASLNLIPAEAEIAVAMRPQKLAQDTDIRKIGAALMQGDEGKMGLLPQLLGGGLARVNEFAPEFMAAFSLGNRSGAAIGEGTYDKRALLAIATLGGGAPPKSSVYKSITVYDAVIQKQPLSFAFLTDKLYAVGSADAIRAVIDVQSGEGPALKGALVKYLDQPDATLVKIAVPHPADAVMNNEKMPSIGAGAGLDQVGSVTLSISKARERVVFRGKVEEGDRDQALKTKAAIEGLLAIVGAIPAVQGSLEIFQDLQLTVSRNTLNFSLSLSAEDVQKLIDEVPSNMPMMPMK